MWGGGGGDGLINGRGSTKTRRENPQGLRGGLDMMLKGRERETTGRDMRRQKWNHGAGLQGPTATWGLG